MTPPCLISVLLSQSEKSRTAGLPSDAESVQTGFYPLLPALCVKSHFSELCTQPPTCQRRLYTSEAATSPATPPTLQEATQLSAPHSEKTQSADPHRPFKVLEDPRQLGCDSKYGGRICLSQDRRDSSSSGLIQRSRSKFRSSHAGGVVRLLLLLSSPSGGAVSLSSALSSPGSGAVRPRRRLENSQTSNDSPFPVQQRDWRR